MACGLRFFTVHLTLSASSPFCYFRFALKARTKRDRKGEREGFVCMKMEYLRKDTIIIWSRFVINCSTTTLPDVHKLLLISLTYSVNSVHSNHYSLPFLLFTPFTSSTSPYLLCNTVYLSSEPQLNSSAQITLPEEEEEAENPFEAADGRSNNYFGMSDVRS